MKQWTIGKKLITSFLAVSAITLVLGIVGYLGAVKSDEAISVVGIVRLPSVQSLLTMSENSALIKAAQRTLLNPELNLADRKRQPEIAAKSKLASDAAWKVYEQLPHSGEEAAIWKEFVPAWEQWQKDNEEFFKINSELEALAIMNPVALQRDLQQFIGDHNKLVLRVLDLAQNGEALNGGDDPTACNYGHWVSKFETTNPVLRRLVDGMHASHNDFHAAVKTSKEMVARGDKTGALKIIHGEMEEAEKKTFEGFKALLAEATKATVLREKLNNQAMSICLASQTKAIALLAKLVEINKKVAADTTKRALAQATTLKVVNLVVMVAGVCLALLLGIFITRSLVKLLTETSDSLSEGSDQVAAASGEISSSSQSLAEGASEQAAALEETSASLEEISSMTKRNAENALSAKELSGETRKAAETGSANMQEMNHAMADIQSASSNIAKIIKTIDEIAFQTNILALNAAVEAARAGEAGAGFAVVADEVRNLAQRSAQAAKETAEKIEDSITKSANGVVISGKVAESLTQIVTKARQVDELVAEIATASREQSQGIDQVNTAVTQMDKVTQTNAAAAEESASASEELTAQAATLRELVADLHRLVTGSGEIRTAGFAREVLQTRPSRTQRYIHPASTTYRPELAAPHIALGASKE